MSTLRVVPDTNIFISAHLSDNPKSPSQELLQRWKDEEFTLLFSWTTLAEYERKLLEKGASPEKVIRFLALIIKRGEEVSVEHFHFRIYPPDPDDIAFLLCAINGKATHLVTHDHHLLGIASFYQKLVKICRPIPCLKDLRKSPQ